MRATDLLENGFKRYFWKSLFGTSIDGLAALPLIADIRQCRWDVCFVPLDRVIGRRACG